MNTIGIIPLYDKEKDSYWIVPGYMKMLQDQGTAPIMLPLTSKPEILDYFINICSGFLLTGGHDISPKLYNAPRHEKCGEICPERDDMEKYILDACIRLDKPVLGICRGIQFINASLGGTLYQDLPSEYNSNIEHHMKPPYNRAAHYADIKKGTLLYDIFGTTRIAVNSYHHQAIKELSPKLKQTAVSEDGLIEAVYMPDKKFIVGVQWHPEFFYNEDIYCKKLIEAFVSSCQ